MREILFRGKNINDGHWLYGTPVSLHSGEIYMNFEFSGWIDRALVYPETVGQYTGLCDKNGKKIFEGDIIKISNGEIYTVVFEAGAFTTGIFSSGFFLGEWDMAHVEVIGNIYDDPELMKTK